MNLIGRYKVTEYILKHPEARIPLLIFLKEFPYRSDRYTGDIQDVSNATFMVDGFDCIIRVQINHFAEAVNIIQISTKAEEMLKWEEASREQEMKGLGRKESTKIVSVVVAAPPPLSIEQINQMEEMKRNSPKIPVRGVIHLASHQKKLSSDAEYLQCLDRVNAIFEFKPGVPEFEELIDLLPPLFNYEEYKLNFPKLRTFELIKNRMDLFEMTSGNLAHLAGSEEALTQFLSGKLILADEVLIRLFDMLNIRVPVNDQRFL
jgi:antitoxin component HigA of HigAB toxin-antitoxin module